MKKILITGANGFIGKNLVAELSSRGFEELYLFTRDQSLKDLEDYTKDCDFVFHLAGVNRPVDNEEFMEGNHKLTSRLIESLTKNNNRAPILITSSIQAEKNNLYGISKKAGEDELMRYSEKSGVNVLVYRLPNVFGKWSKPNYNTVVATYCYNISRNLEIKVNNPDAFLELVYIDDLIKEFLGVLKGDITTNNIFCSVPITYQMRLGELAEIITNFKENRNSLTVPKMNNELIKKLYSTYLSFLPINDFSYDLKMNVDHRGSFTEFIKTIDRGQISINISKPGITKGNHWHHTKNEKFLVVSGSGLIRFRNFDSKDIIEYRVSGKKLQVVDIPPGYTHSIVNVGESDLITIMWVNEIFDVNMPDTHYLEV